MPERERKNFEEAEAAEVIIAPRGIGPTRYAEAGTPADVQIRRRFALLGQTLDGQRVWDVRRALALLRTQDDFKGAEIGMGCQGEMGVIALYAAIFEPDVARLNLAGLPPSHRQGPTFLNVRRVLDTPQALLLVYPRKVYLRLGNRDDLMRWDWALQLNKSLGGDFLKVETRLD